MQYSVTESLKKALDLAHEIAKKYSNPEIGTEHILYGILVEGKSYSASVLRELGMTKEGLHEFYKEHEGVEILGDIDFTAKVKQMFSHAGQLAKGTGTSQVTTEHLFYCMLQDGASIAWHILRGHYKADMHGLSEQIKKHAKTVQQADTTGRGVKPLPAQLKDLGQDLTQRASEGKIDPVIGRGEEIERIIQILCRKTKNNPVLIGEPGVGKSAVVEGLSLAIVEGRVPDLLKDKIIFTLEIGALVAGTKYRGALEERLKNAIDLIMHQKNIIVFIDELHTLAQAGSKEGEVTPADILKPYLARGELQTIGATTTDEYRKFIEKDKGLERRFQPITVAPPSVEETIKILHGIRENYEAFHKVKVTDSALEAAAKLSDRYIMDRFLPDKAIDLIDEAMSRAKVNSYTAPPNMKELEEKLAEIENKKQEAIKSEDFSKASTLRDEGKKILEEIEQIKLNWSKNSERAFGEITEEDVAQIIAKWTKIPLTRLTETESQRLVGLEEILKGRVIGQDEAVVNVSKSIRRARAGLKDPNRPIGSFIFLGPTGVGKTELTKALTEALFDDESAIIRLDMSEYMEAHSISKLIGSPPGYIGHDDGGQLTEQVRRKPYSVVLFDEIEKGHPDIYNTLLQILDDGRLTDSQGRVVSFKNCLIIMTSNVGVSDLKFKKSALGFATEENQSKKEEDATREILMNGLKNKFRPEFLNRVDAVTIFKNLTKDDIKKIAIMLLKKTEKNLGEKNIRLELSKEAMNHIIEKGYDVEYGARPLRRAIEQTIDDAIAENILDGTIKEGDTALIDFKNDKIVVKTRKK
ncbi:MAG: ATP-dependent Clp protease ATP-binding subunit [Firmicutes bacterium]|nr:ATP-dependent Clp protease ATP-binding subunit [Bacillota bacterium]MCL2255896.1 ATP-dependent Clp protease ATP-binding subunit [Bacillota bacterium]